MDRDGPHDRRQELAVVAGVGEVAQRLQPGRQLRGRRRYVQGDRGVTTVLHDHVVRGGPQPAGLVRFVQCVVHQQPVDLQDRIDAQWPVTQASERLHHRVVVEDHLLAAVARRPAGAEHFLGDLAGGRRAFKLRGGHRFLDQRAHQIAPADRLIVDPIGTEDHAGRLAIEEVQLALHGPGDRHGERVADLVVQWQFTRDRPPCELDRRPPVLCGQADWRGQVPEVVPVFVRAIDLGTDSAAQHLFQSQSPLTKQVGQLRSDHGQFHSDPNYQFDINLRRIYSKFSGRG